MENYLMLNGKRINLTAEQIETLVGKKEKDPFERVNAKAYYCIDEMGKVTTMTDLGGGRNIACHDVANYCTDKELMEQRALHVILNQQLWRYSMQHGGRDMDWDNDGQKWFVFYNWCSEDFDATFTLEKLLPGVAYFRDYFTANAAIEEIVKPFMEKHPEFRW